MGRIWTIKKKRKIKKEKRRSAEWLRKTGTSGHCLGPGCVQDSVPTVGCSGLGPSSLEVCPRMEMPQPLWQPVQCLATLAIRKLCLMFKWNFLYVHLFLLSLGLSLGTTEESVSPSSLLLSSGSSGYKIAWSQLFSSLNTLSLSLYEG